MCSLHICLCTTPVPGTHEGQLRALVPLALGLRVVVWSWELNLVLYRATRALTYQTISPGLSLFIIIAKSLGSCLRWEYFCEIDKPMPILVLTLDIPSR